MKKKEKKPGFWAEFKQFIARGNIMDLAIGVIIGGAFGKIVTSLVNDIIMPLVALAMGGTTMAGLAVVLNGVPKYVIDQSTQAQVINPEAVLWNYGNFIQTVIDFLIIALVVFLFMKIIMKVKKAGEEVKDKLVELGKHEQADADAAKDADVAAEEAVPAAAPAEPAPVVEAPAEPAPTAAAVVAANARTEELLAEIRDLLKSGAADKKDA